MPDFLVLFFATFLLWFLFFGLIILWFIDGKIKKEQVVHALLAVTISWLIAYFIKYLFPTVRPFLVNGADVGVFFAPTDSAFPSGHTTQAFALAVTIFLHDKKIGWVYLICALLIGIFRIVANVHYPIDILGGALLGTLVAMVIEKIHPFKLLTFSRR